MEPVYQNLDSLEWAAGLALHHPRYLSVCFLQTATNWQKNTTCSKELLSNRPATTISTQNPLTQPDFPAMSREVAVRAQSPGRTEPLCVSLSFTTLTSLSLKITARRTAEGLRSHTARPWSPPLAVTSEKLCCALSAYATRQCTGLTQMKFALIIWWTMSSLFFPLNTSLSPLTFP